MKIIFLCGSLEPGRDGVGDYVRRLACELIQLGNEAAAISLNDYYISEAIESTQLLENTSLPILRLPSEWSEKKRFQTANKWINKLDPDWVSLQFVPYSFQSLGLPFSFSVHITNLLRKRRTHIMIHETWFGMGKGFNLKLAGISYIQRFLLKRILLSLRPEIIHTHLPEYKRSLEHFKIGIRQLPLFSNIQVKADPVNFKRTNPIVIGFFSQVECSKSILAFLSAIAEKAMHCKTRVEVLLIGGNQSKMKQFGHYVESLRSFKGMVKYTGFLNSEELSKALGSCSFGVTPVPRHGLGKSGSVAAFLAHGIAVAAPNVDSRKTPTEIGFFSSSLKSSIVTEPDFLTLIEATKILKKAKSEITVFKVAQTFVNDLCTSQIN